MIGVQPMEEWIMVGVNELKELGMILREVVRVGDQIGWCLCLSLMMNDSLMIGVLLLLLLGNISIWMDDVLARMAGNQKRSKSP